MEADRGILCQKNQAAEETVAMDMNMRLHEKSPLLFSAVGISQACHQGKGIYNQITHCQAKRPVICYLGTQHGYKEGGSYDCSRRKD